MKTEKQLTVIILKHELKFVNEVNLQLQVRINYFFEAINDLKKLNDKELDKKLENLYSIPFEGELEFLKVKIKKGV